MAPGLALLAASLLTSLVSAVQYITVDGANFVTNTSDERFSIIGVDYQPGGSSGFTSTADPLSDSTTCLRDAILMQDLGVNTIRVYNLDADLDHDECASIFNAAGIYMILDVNSGLSGTYIDRSDPASTYTLSYLKHIFGIIEAFARYPNTLGFFAGNEIINEDSVYEAPAYIRAVVRDMKEYIAYNIPRSVGVGYSAADVEDMLSDTWNYLGCELENSTYSKIDFFGLNDYEWCGDSSYTESGYDELVDLFEDTAIPVFFSEYGCNDVKPRTFTNVPVLYGSQMTVLSGGLVYEWTQEDNDYGLVVINSTNVVTLTEDFNYLQEEYNKIDMSLLTTLNKTETAKSATSCAASLITESAFIDSWDLPDRPSGGDSIVTSGLSNPNKGTQVTVSATTMAATVYNVSGAQVTGLKLHILDEEDDNYPGLAETYTATGYTGLVTLTGSAAGEATASSSSSSGSSSSSSDAGLSLRVPGVGLKTAAVFASTIFVAMLAL